ncbi:MAG: ATP-binding protein [Verrucomicrobia bacterium]|nr:ATP-binding protein [Verrucomicrobiota bacterium]
MQKHCWTLAAASLALGNFSTDSSGASDEGVPAGAPFAIDVWQNDDGLPQNSVISMTQTRDGYLWLGTINGLVRFDGFRFTVFDESNTPGLGSSGIVHIFEDEERNLWIGTEAAGVALVKKDRVTRLDIGRGTREGRVMSACQDSTGAVWLYTADGQLCRHREGRVDVWLAGAESFSNCRAIVSERSGMLWIGSDRRLFAIDPADSPGSSDLKAKFELPVRKLDLLIPSRRGGFWMLADNRTQRWLTNRLELNWGGYPWKRTPVTVACEDIDGNLIVGTQGAGVFWFDTEGVPTRLTTRQGLSHNLILSLHVDREGTLWVGTDGGGLNRVKRQVFDVQDESRGLTVRSVAEDKEGGLWIGFNILEPDFEGAAYFKDGQLRRFGPNQGLMNSSVYAVFVDRSQRVWAGTWGGLFQFQKEADRFQRVAGTESIHPVVLAIHQDRAGQLWLGTQGGLARWDEKNWKVFTTRDGLSADDVRAIADDPEGNLWVGTRGGGLNRLREGKFSSFHRKDGLPSEDISSLYVDGEGVLWIGTFGSGLGRFQAGHWTRYTTAEGLISNSVGYLIEDSQGYLWIGSNVGLMRVPKKTLNDFAAGLTAYIHCRAYRKQDGLPTRECTSGSQPGACLTGDGKLWFPTIKGLASVDPTQLHPNVNPPPVTIESVLIEGQPQSTDVLRRSLPQTVTVPSGKEHVEINYTSLNLAAPDRARFKYRLEGHETAWIEAGNSRVARYSKLPPGRYRFAVTACNEDDVWNEIGSGFALIVPPPFWRTWWFLGGTSAALLGAIIAMVHSISTQRLRRQLERLRQKEAIEKERARIARDIHDQLGASLTQVALLGELVEADKASPAEVEAHARQISQTARDTTRSLDEIVWTVNPSNDTLDGLITYVCKYAQEYLEVAGLRYRLDVPAQLPEATILPEVRHNVFLAAKEAVTNVVRHAQATAVRIRLSLDSGTFTLEIEDNGRGFVSQEQQAAPSRNGLRNMRKRMEEIGGSFAIAPAPESGTVVRLTSPLHAVEVRRAS